MRDGGTPAPGGPGAGPPAERRRLIAARARDLGFDDCRFCAPDPPAETDLYRAWLARGFHGRMEWMRRSMEKRLDPNRVLPGVRTLVLLSLGYGPQDPPTPAALSGEVSCYAWGEDYHGIAGGMAGELAAQIRDRFGARAIEYVDTGPLLERLWAARSGVGWIGKNSLVLNRERGSFFFLAVILTDLEIATDEPALDQCGACTSCIEACPTGAIVEERTVDSRRCLSYHTIELRGSFPDEFREALGVRLFGCDDCQTACPWNQREARAPERFRPQRGNGRPDLAGMILMTLPEYTERFRGSALTRATYHGLRRNAAIALGNLLSADAAQDRPRLQDADRARAAAALQAAAADPEPSVAEAARWALARG